MLSLASQAMAQTTTSTSSTPSSYSVILMMSQPAAGTVAATPGAPGSLAACSCSNNGTTYACGATFTGTITSTLACPSPYLGSGSGSATGPYICDASGVIEPNGLVHTTSDYSGCVKYTAPVYSACAPACGASTESLTGYTCVNANGATVADSICAAAGAVPPATVACTSTDTCTYVVSNVTYSPACSSTCGTGTEALVSYTCTRSDGVTVANSFCTAPPATQACTSTSGCTYTATPTYSPTCSNACGTGTEALVSFTCTRNDGTVVANSFCTAPPATQACTSTSGCTYTATPTYSPTCSNLCGTGTEALVSYTCTRNSDGTTVANSFCTAPPATQSCTSTSGCTYTYTAANYGACTPACGASSQALVSYTCTRSDGTVVNDSYCVTAGQVPPATQTCTSTSGCDFTYTAATYGSCTPACGASTQPLTGYTCTRSDGTVVADSFCATAGVVPPATQACTDTTACTYTYTAATYGSCSPACGASTEPLTGYTCTRSDNVVVADSLCAAAGQVPPATQACTSTASCSYTWWPLGVACTPACGTSTTYGTSYECIRSDNAVVDNSYCQNALGNPSLSTWVADGGGSATCTDYSACSGTCGSTLNTCQTGSTASAGAADPANGQDVWVCTGSNGTAVNCSIPVSPACGSDNGGNFTASNPPWNNAPGAPWSNLCNVGGTEVGNPSGNPTYDGVHFGWTCTTGAGAVSCSANVITVGSDNGGNFATPPYYNGAVAGNLCEVGGVQTYEYAENFRQDANYYYWDCAGVSGQANVITVGSDNGGNFSTPPYYNPAVAGNLCQVGGVQTYEYSENFRQDANHYYYDCAGVPGEANVITVGPANGQTVTSSPFTGSLANQLCMVGGVPTGAYAENEAFNGTSYTYDCAGVQGSVNYQAPYTYHYWPTGVACSTQCGGGTTVGTGYFCRRDQDGAGVDPSLCAGQPQDVSYWVSQGGSATCTDNSQCIGCGADQAGTFGAASAPWTGSAWNNLCTVGGNQTGAPSGNGTNNGTYWGWTCANAYGTVNCFANNPGYYWWPTGVACSTNCGTGSTYGTGWICAESNDGQQVDNSYCQETVGNPSLNWWINWGGGNASCSDNSGCPAPVRQQPRQQPEWRRRRRGRRWQ